jgi:hypothetical protein
LVAAELLMAAGIPLCFALKFAHDDGFNNLSHHLSTLKL